MLNLPIAMFGLFLFFSAFFQNSPLAINSPQPGEVVQGVVEIQGTMDLPNFGSAELAFTFDASASDPAANWFIVQTFPQPILNSSLAAWDTTALTDGDYALRLRVTLQDGSIQETLVAGLKVRNDIAIPTDTAAPTLADFNFQFSGGTPDIRVQPTATLVSVRPTSTPLPPNPATLNTTSIVRIFWQSALVAVAVFAFFALILRVRKNN